MSWVGAGVAVAGVGLSIFGASKAAKRAKKLGKLNASLWESTAQYLEETGAERLRRFQLDSKALYSSQAQAYANSGVRTSEGSPLEILYQTSRELAFEKKFMVKHNAYEVQQARINAEAAKMGGAAPGQALPWEAAALGLNTLSTVMRGVGPIGTGGGNTTTTNTPTTVGKAGG